MVRMYPVIKFNNDILVFNSGSAWMTFEGPLYAISFSTLSGESAKNLEKELQDVLKKYFDHLPPISDKD